MNKKTKTWLIIGAILILVGVLLFAGAMTALKWDFTKLSTTNYKSNSYDIGDEFTDISIETDTSKVEFFTSNDNTTHVECHEQDNVEHDVFVENNVLNIKLNDTRKWYEHIGIGFGKSTIKIYLPAEQYAKLVIETDTGDINIPKDFKFESINISASTANITNLASTSEDITIKTSTGDILTESASAGSIDLSVSTGDVTLSDVECTGDVKIKVSTGKTFMTNVKCESLNTSGSTGNVILNKVIINDKLSIKRSTGDVKLNSCDASEIFVKTDTGDVKGTLRSEKVFITETSTGKINVPKSIKGGRCEVTTDTGDIIIDIGD